MRRLGLVRAQAWGPSDVLSHISSISRKAKALTTSLSSSYSWLPSSPSLSLCLLCLLCLRVFQAHFTSVLPCLLFEWHWIWYFFGSCASCFSLLSSLFSFFFSLLLLLFFCFFHIFFSFFSFLFIYVQTALVLRLGTTKLCLKSPTKGFRRPHFQGEL